MQVIDQFCGGGEICNVPRYYFTVHDNDGEAPDDEGAELPDVEAALLHAAKGARCMMSDRIKAGELDLTAFIDIENDRRVVVARLVYREAVSIRE